MPSPFRRVALRVFLICSMLATAISATTTSAAPAAPTPQQASCQDLYFIGVRGTEEVGTPDDLWMGPTVNTFYNKVAVQAQKNGLTIAGFGAAYQPYVSVTDWIRHKLGSKGLTKARQAGIVKINELVDEKLAAQCPDMDFILSGYSLGAWIVSEWLRDNGGSGGRAERLDGAVVLFGDPQFDGCDVDDDDPENCTSHVIGEVSPDHPQASQRGEGMVRVLGKPKRSQPSPVVTPYMSSPLLPPDESGPIHATEMQDNSVSYCLTETHTYNNGKGGIRQHTEHDPICHWKIYNDLTIPEQQRGDTVGRDDGDCLSKLENCIHTKYQELVLDHAVNFLNRDVLR